MPETGKPAKLPSKSLAPANDLSNMLSRIREVKTEDKVAAEEEEATKLKHLQDILANVKKSKHTQQLIAKSAKKEK